MFSWVYQSTKSTILFIRYPINVNMALIRENYVINTEVFSFQCLRKVVKIFIPSSAIMFIPCLENLNFTRNDPIVFLQYSSRQCVWLLPVSEESVLLICTNFSPCVTVQLQYSLGTWTLTRHPEQALFMFYNGPVSFIFHTNTFIVLYAGTLDAGNILSNALCTLFLVTLFECTRHK